METGLAQTFRRRHVLVEHVPEMLDDFCGDARAACGGVRDIDGAVGEFDNGGSDGGEGSFEGFDEVGGRGGVAKGVDSAGDGEI